jgi:uncharacterized membrane protein YbhN (UPF0104 family)
LFVNFTFLVIGAIVTLKQGLLGEAAALQVLLFVLGLLLLPTLYLALLWFGSSPLSWAVRRTLALDWMGRTAWGQKLGRLPGTIARAEAQVGHFCRERPLALFAALVISLVVWLAMVAEYWLMLRFLGLPLTLAQAIMALTAARLAYLAPTPMALGALEAGQALAIEALGADPAFGLGASLLMRARDISLGLAGVWLAGFITRPGVAGDAASPANEG